MKIFIIIFLLVSICFSQRVKYRDFDGFTKDRLRNLRAEQIGDTSKTLRQKWAYDIGDSLSQSIIIAAYNASIADKYLAKYICDGIDDEVQIQQALTALSSGGVVKLSEGNFSLSITAYKCLTIYSHQKIKGMSESKTILKIKNNAGSYNYLLGSGNSCADALNNFTLKNLTIDMNETDNPTASQSDLLSHARMTLKVYVGTDLEVRNVTIKNITSINTIVFNGSTCERANIENCKFLTVGGNAAGFDHDHSTIYTNARSVSIINNVFEATSYFADGARTAIETHGSNHLINNNKIKNFQKGMNITGIWKEDTKNVIVTNNVMTDVFYGIGLWSFEYGSHTTGWGFDGLTVSDNIIHINQTYHKLYTQASGISFVENSGLDEMNIKNVSIINNTIVYKDQGDTNYCSGAYTRALGLRSADTMKVYNLRIEDNTIDYPAGSGLYVNGADLHNCKFNNNIISYPSAADTSWWFEQPFFFASNDYYNVEINNNQLSDEYDTTRAKYGYYITQRDTTVNLRVDNFNYYLGGSVQTGWTAKEYLGTGVTLGGISDTYGTLYLGNQSAVTLATAGGTYEWVHNSADSSLWALSIYYNNNVTPEKDYLIVNTAGKFKIDLSLTVSLSSNGWVRLGHSKNSTNYHDYARQHSLATEYGQIRACMFNSFAAGDTIKPIIASSGTITVTPYSGSFFIEKLED